MSITYIHSEKFENENIYHPLFQEENILKSKIKGERIWVYYIFKKIMFKGKTRIKMSIAYKTK